MHHFPGKITQPPQEFSGKLCTFPLKPHVAKKDFTGWGFLSNYA